MEMDEKKCYTHLSQRHSNKKQKIVSVSPSAITVNIKINTISEYKILVENKWTFTQDGLAIFREKANNNKNISDFNYLVSQTKLETMAKKRN